MKKLLLISLAAIWILGGCKKDWDGHNAITDDQLKSNLFERIQANSKLSKFAELLVKSGNDKVLASSKNFTVFAPTNDALASLDPAIVNDAVRLMAFVENHIANQSYYSSRITDTIRIEMLNHKFHNMLGKKIELSNIQEADLLANNGVLQVVDKILPVLANSWEVMLSNPDFPTQQAAYLKSLDYEGFDPNTAEVIGIDPLTGAPIYKAGTGTVPRNVYWDKVYDLRREEKQFTFFALENAGLDGEVTKFKPYYTTTVPAATDSFTRFAIIKDFAFEGKYDLAALPDTLISKSGVKVGIDKSKITKTIAASNGVVYVMSALSVAPATKFVSRIIEAENYVATSHDRRGNTFFRDRMNPLTSKPYRDVLVTGHGVALFNMRYLLADMPAMKYKAYWVAVNDFQAASFNQKLGISIPTSTTLPYIAVPANNFNEVLLGEFTLSSFNPVFEVFLTAANSTTAAANPLVCDYIRLEPVN